VSKLMFSIQFNTYIHYFCSI